MSGQSVTKAFVPLPGGAAAVYTGSTLAWYRHPDWLGSSRLASTPGGGLAYDGAYAPFGETEAESGTTDRSFTGQNQDLTANLYDFPYREYNPLHGRWISPDPAGVTAVNPASPQSWNRYAYVNGDPLRRTDVKGLCSQWFLPQTGPQGSCTNAGLMAYGMNQDTFWSWQPGQPSPTGETFYSWTSAPTGLSNKGTISDADLGVMQGGYYANEQAKQFWNNLAQIVYPWAGESVGSMSGGAIGPKPLQELTPDQVSPAPPGGPTSITAPMTLPFAPGPAPFNGPCPKRSFPWPTDLYGAGQCVALGAVPPGLAPPPQPAP
jgi:RHS repeat-associated protein